MKQFISKFLFVLFSFLALQGNAQRPLHIGMNENKIDVIKGVSVFYLPCIIYLPWNYFSNPTKKFPIIFYGHGVGEAGNDTVHLLSSGPLAMLNNGATPTTYINETGTSYNPSGVFNLYGQKPRAKIGADSIEAIIVAAQHSSYSPGAHYVWGEWEDATTRLFPGRIDSTRVYMLGYSAGGLGSIAAVVGGNGDPADTTYTKYISAIIGDQLATQDIDFAKVRNIGVRGIPTFLLDGLADISYRDQARRLRDSINAVSPPKAVLEEIAGECHCNFTTHADTLKSYAAAGNKNYWQWLFQYQNNYAGVPPPASCNPTPVTWTLGPEGVNDPQIRRLNGNGLENVRGGDTIYILAGTYTLIQLGNFHGSEGCPVIIKNKNGIVNVTPNGMSFQNNAHHFQILGNGWPGATYGFKINGPAFAYALNITRAHHYEVGYFDLTGTDVGIGCHQAGKWDDSSSQYPNYPFRKVYIHHNYIHNVTGEAIYAGDTYPKGNPYFGQPPCGPPNGWCTKPWPVPNRMDSVEIAFNIIDSTGWDGIQLSNARNGNLIHDNSVRNYGRRNTGGQQAGIIIGGNSRGNIYNNVVSVGTGNAIEAFGFGHIEIYNNILDSAGMDGTNFKGLGLLGQDFIFAADYIDSPEVADPLQFLDIHNNVLKHVRTIRDPDGNILWGRGINVIHLPVITDPTNPSYHPYYNSDTTRIYNNQFCITGDTVGWHNAGAVFTFNDGVHTETGNTLIGCNTVTPPPNQPPIVNAGTNKNITLPTSSVSQVGSATDADGTIAAYLWTKLSGPATFNIVTPTTPTTTINGLTTAGTYVFRLRATDNLGDTGIASATIVVNASPPANIPPISIAGTNKNITLPVDSVIQVGSGTDQDGTVVSYAWSKTSGPATYTIMSPSSSTTEIEDLVEGVYVFTLTVTDNLGATGTSTVTVTVNALPNVNPTANAGINQTVTLPTNTVSVSASGSTDSDGTVVGYSWIKISGPVGGIIQTPSTVTTNINNLASGVYIYRVTVTDNNGATSIDDIQITVNPAVSSLFRQYILIRNRLAQ